MADYNNQRGSYRSNQDWNDNRGRNGRNMDDDRNYGYENRGGNNEYDEGNSGWQSRYEREEYNRGDRYNPGRFGRSSENDWNNNSGSDRDFGGTPYYGSRESYGNGYRSKNLYDRDYEGMNRSSYANSGTRLGAGNYSNYGDRGRTSQEMRNQSQNFGNSGYYPGDYNRDRDYNRGSEGNRNEDRNWWDRTSDEVSSWFGNEEAERRRNRMMGGQHRGKGPKNYSRSDDRIREDINDRLSDDAFIDASEVEVMVMNGEVTLTGTVDNRSTKRRAEDIAEDVSGVKNVENKLRVSQTAESGMSRTGSDSNRSAEKESETKTVTSAVPGSERSRNKSYVTG